MSIGEPHAGSKTGRRKFDSRKLWEGVDASDYSNPIIHADYSDPDVLRHGDDYYMTASSFNCTPGLPILHSRDLVNWTIINHAVQNLPGKRFEQVQPGCGIWAPSIRYHDGSFWIYFAMPDEGIYFVKASDPRGEWTTPHLVEPGKGLIDPCPLWDDDGQAYLVHAYAHSRSGLRDRLHVRPMSTDGMRLIGEGQIIFEDAESHPIIEGPKFLKKDGWYYIFAPAGGVATGWQVALRSRHIFGPYDAKIVLEQGESSVNGPHQGAMVETSNGEWWFFHFQDAGPYGRIVHLQPVVWNEGWPVIGIDQDGNGIGEPVLRFRKPSTAQSSRGFVIQTSDEFDRPRLGPQWQWNANHQTDWYSLSAAPGWLRLYGQPAPGGTITMAPHLLLQKFPACTFTAITRLRMPQSPSPSKAGLVVIGNEHAGLFASSTGGISRLERISSDRDFAEVADVKDGCAPHADYEVSLRVDVREDAVCSFSYSLDGREFYPVGGDFQATPGKWIGARVGIVVLGNDSYSDFEYFRIS